MNKNKKLSQQKNVDLIFLLSYNTFRDDTKGG
jgi:hypothetical protein